MRKFSVRWWVTPAWLEEQRKRNIGEWRVDNTDYDRKLRDGLRRSVSEFAIYLPNSYCDMEGCHKV